MISEKIRELAPSIAEEIKKSRNILLHCHPSPDPDSVGSALAMKSALENMGKIVTVIQGDDSIPHAFDFPGKESILQKSYSEIDQNAFDLFIVLDAASINMISYRAEPHFPESMRVIVIDHHISNTGYGHINLVVPEYPATAQVIYDLLTEMKVQINHDIALNLFMGIYADTGGFQFGYMSPDTFRIVADLVSLAPDFTKTIFTMNNSHTMGNIIFESLALSSLKYFFSNRLGIASVSYKQIIDNHIDEEDVLSSIIANKIKSVTDTMIGICMIEESPGIVKMSIRTRDEDKYDVSKLAVAMGGGGHKAAAGARINGTIENAIEKVVENVGKLYNL